MKVVLSISFIVGLLAFAPGIFGSTQFQSEPSQNTLLTIENIWSTKSISSQTDIWVKVTDESGIAATPTEGTKVSYFLLLPNGKQEQSTMIYGPNSPIKSWQSKPFYVTGVNSNPGMALIIVRAEQHASVVYKTSWVRIY